ncbi:MAG: hypothetical protein AAGB93_13600 [Planctomycetota bacterium]
MDTIEQQIHEFRHEATEGVKPRLIEDLSYTEDERILPFLLEVLCDADEVDLARIEAAKALMVDIERQRDAICEALISVIERDGEDEGVRSHAVQAASPYVNESDELLDAVKALLFAGETDDETRSSALATVHDVRPAERCLEILDDFPEDDPYGDVVRSMTHLTFGR